MSLPITEVRQRCQATLAGRPTDRLATYLPGIACSVSSEVLGRPAFTGTGSLHFAEVAAWANGEQAHAEFEEKLIQDLIEIHRALDIDILRMPWRRNRRPTGQIDEFTFLFGDPERDHQIWRYNPESADFGIISQKKWEAVSVERYRDSVERAERDQDNLRARIESELLSLQELQDAAGDEFFVVGVNAMIMVGNDERSLLLLAMEPDLVRRSMMLKAEQAVMLGEMLVTSDCPNVIGGGGDLAGAQGSMYSPQAFREVMLPAYKLALEGLNSLGVHYYFRSDGNIWPLTDMLFIEAMCPGYGEADFGAGMTAEALRRRYPRLVIWGNVSSTTLFHGSPTQVREESLRIAEGARWIGYFKGCSNASFKGTSPENVEAMYSVR